MKKFVSTLLVMLLLISSVPMMASAATVNESEDNNSYAKANTLAIGNTIRGKMNNSSDEDYYKITTSSTGKLYISFDHDYMDSYDCWTVELYLYSDSKYTELSRKEFYANESGTFTFPFIGAVSDGTYYIKVYNNYGDTSKLEYRISSKFVPTDYAEKELNDSYQTANTLTIGQKHFGTSNHYEDQDFYKISTSSTGKLYISFDHDYVDKYACWTVELYLYSDYKYTKLSSKEIYANESGTFDFPFIGAVSGKTYYIKVCNSFENASGIEYSISSKFISTDYAERELNDSFQTANTLTIGQKHSGTSNRYEDQDFYKVSTSSTGKLYISFDHDYADKYACWTVELYLYSDNKYTELSRKEIYANESGTFDFPFVGAVSDKTYYIKVCNSFENASGIEYSISSKFISTDYAERELNDSYQTANTLTIDQTFSGTTSNYDDQDFYKITTSSSGKLYISFDHDYIDTDSYWNVTLYLFSNNKYTELCSQSVYAHDSGTYNFPFVGTTPNGIYYIKISNGYQSAAGIEYMLSAKFIPTEYAEKELNDSYQAANVIALNNEYAGTMNSDNDQDFYKFTATTSGNIPITFRHKYKDQNGYWRITVYSYQNNEYKEIANKEINVNNSVESDLLYTISAVKNITYFVKITNGYEYATGNEYTILLGQKSAPTTYTVTYNANGGSVSPSSAKVTAGGSVTLPTPTKTGCTCLGWSASSSATTASYSCGTSYKPTQNITLYAVWKKNAPTMCTLTYNANGGSVSPSSATFEMGKTVTLPTPTRSGYTCLGWSTNKSATSAEYECGKSYTILGSATLYAVWQKNSTDKAQVYGVTLQDSISVDYKGTAKIIPTIDKDRNAKYSVKWESSNSSVVSVDNDGNIHGLKKGSAKVTCTVTDSYGNTYSDSCNVNVKYSGVQWVIIIVLFGWIWYI